MFSVYLGADVPGFPIDRGTSGRLCPQGVLIAQGKTD